MPRFDWVACIIGVFAFYVFGFATDWFHDFLFLSHTSIQNDVEACAQIGGRFSELDCEVEDGVRAYTSEGWALIGNAVAITFLAARAFLGLFVYVLACDYPFASLATLFLLPAAVALSAIFEHSPAYFHIANLLISGFCASIAVWCWQIRVFTPVIPLFAAAFIFNPFFDIQLSRSSWQILDALVASLLIGMLSFSWWIARGDVGSGDLRAQDDW